MSETARPESLPALGLRANLPQFTFLFIVNAFVGAVMGMERSILPAIATGCVAAHWSLRPEPFYLGVVFVACGLFLSVFLVKETHAHARAQAALVAALTFASGVLVSLRMTPTMTPTLTTAPAVPTPSPGGGAVEAPR
jgi:hypothetical protein